MKIFRFIIVAFLILPALNSSGQNEIPQDFCIYQNEYELVEMINDYRKTFNQPKLNLSNSLCYVAYLHNMDMFTNKPDTGICNMHSWSDKGNWEACCYNSKMEDRNCMNGKPVELTNFPGEGYELVYWDSKYAEAKDAFDLWRSIPYSQNILLNQEQWSESKWKSIGVSVDKAYSIIWLSTYDDVENLTKICNSDRTIAYFEDIVDTNISVIKNKTGRYFLIVASLQNLEEAMGLQEKYKDLGYDNAKLIICEERIRISIDDFLNETDAIERKSSLQTKYPDVWMLRY